MREAATECTIDSEQADEILPDYNLSVATEEKTDGSGNKILTFTAVANIKRVPVIINKNWGERVEDDDKEGVKLTYTVYRVKKNSAGNWIKEDIYGTTNTKDDGIEMTMQMPNSNVPDVTMGKLLMNNTDPDNAGANVVTKYYSKLDAKTKAYYSNTDVIYLPILRSSSADDNVKYMVTETASKNGLEKKYFVTFASESGKTADEFEQLNPRGKNVEEAGNPANAGLFRLNDTGAIIAVVNGGNSWQNVAFMKIDNNGDPLNGAEFTLYDNAACTEETQAVRDNAIKSKTQRATVNGVPKNAYQGIVDFGEVPSGIYFMKETEAPALYKSDKKFVVVVGRDFMDINTLKNEDATVFADITQADLDAQNDAQLKSSMSDSEKEEARKYYAIFEMKGDKADSDTDIVNYAVMNEVSASRKVILRKTNSGYSPLAGAEFTIYKYDMTKYDETIASKSSGVFYIDEMPYGTYYLKETKAPSGYGDNADKYFKLTVNADGATVGRGVKDLVRQKYVVYTTEGYNPDLYEVEVDNPKSEYAVDDTIQLSLNVDGTKVSTSVYGNKLNLTAFGGNVQFANDNKGITLLDTGDITLMLEVKEDITIGDKIIQAGTMGTIDLVVNEPHMYPVTVVNPKDEYLVGDTIQLSMNVNGTKISTAEYGDRIRVITEGCEVGFEDDNNGIKLLEPGNITLTLKLRRDITIGGKTIKAGKMGSIDLNVKEPPEQDDNNGGDNG